MSELADARAVAAERRRALIVTANQLQGKALPLAVALHDAIVAVDRAKRRGARLAEQAGRRLKEPKAISAVVAVATAIISFNLFRRIRKGGGEGDVR